jgi:tetratricopeptide (TPR) repeat protein
LTDNQLPEYKSPRNSSDSISQFLHSFGSSAAFTHPHESEKSEFSTGRGIIMRRLLLVAALGCLCGCGSGSSKMPPLSGSDKQSATPALASQIAETPRETADRSTDDWREIESVLRQAQKLISMGQLGHAREMLNQLIAAHPEAAAAFIVRGQAYAESRRDAAALADFSTAVKLEPQCASHRMARGIFQFRRGNCREALQDFQEAARLNPKDASACNQSGMARLVIGDVKPALEDFNKAIELDPKLAQAYVSRSMAWLKMDRRTDAMADLDRAIELDPNDAAAHNNRGILRARDQDYPKAIADFGDAIRLDGNNISYYRNRRETYLRMQKFAEAQSDAVRLEQLMTIAALNDAVFRDPKSPKPFVQRGAYLLDQGQLQAALVNFDRALKLDPRDWRAYLFRARVWLRGGAFKKAIDDSTAALAIEPREEAYSIRGDAYRKLGDYGKATADYEASNRFDRIVAETWALQSQALRNAGREKEAADAMKRSNEILAVNAPASSIKERVGKVSSSAN